MMLLFNMFVHFIFPFNIICNTVLVVIFGLIHLNRKQNAIRLLLFKWLFGQTAIICVAICILAIVMNVVVYSRTLFLLHFVFVCSVPRALLAPARSRTHFLLLIRSLNHMIYILL